MTDRLEEIRKRLEAGYPPGRVPQLPSAMADVVYLLAEVERLQYELAEYTVCMDCGHLYKDGVCRPDICSDTRGWPEGI